MKIHDLVSVNLYVIGIGSMRASSVSKIKKIIAIRKKWIEKGKRGEDIWENPHSKGDLFVRFIFDFIDNKNDIKHIIERIRVKERAKLITLIIFLSFNLLIGNQLYLLY